MSDDSIIVSTNLLRSYFNRFIPSLDYDFFFKPGDYYTPGPPCDLIQLCCDFDDIRQRIETEEMQNWRNVRRQLHLPNEE